MPMLGGGGSSAITSSNIVDNEIVNADVNAAAGIVYSKLNLTNSIKGTDMSPEVIKTAEIAVSSAEILALHTTSKELLPAPGAGKINVVDEIVFKYVNGGVNYANAVEIYVYYNGYTDKLVEIPGTTTINGASIILGCYPVVTVSAAKILTNGTNASVILKLSSASINGNGTLKLFIKYRILTL